MAVVLVSKEMARDDSLMHYRVGGEKKGVRRYQNKDGSYTPEGYRHYKEMYGWGDRKKKKETSGESGDTRSKEDKNLMRSLADPGKSNKKSDSSSDGDTISRHEYKSILRTAKQDSQEIENEWREMLLTAKNDSERESINRNYYELASGMAKSRTTLERNAGHPDLEKKFREEAERLLTKSKGGSENEGPKEQKKPSFVERARERIEEAHERNKPMTRKEERAAEKEAEKNAEDAVNKLNEKIQEKKEERAASKQSLQDRIKSISKMSDAELNAGITRLQKEKQLAELINEQEAREKGPLHQYANQLFKKAADKLSDQAVDLVVKNMMNKLASKAAQRAAQNNSNSGNNNNNNSGGNSGGSSGTLSKGQKNQVRSLAASGKTVAELAQQFNVSESYISQLINGN